jgi:hypothetical protein
MLFLNCCRANEIKNDFIINNEKSENSKKEMNNSIISSTKKREIVNSQNNSNPIINNTNQNNVILNENQNNMNFTQISFGNLDFSTANNSISSGKLLLTGNLFFNKELIITQNGLVNSLRKRIDGQTFFGTSNAKDYTGTFYNDFVLNLPDDDNKNQEILSHTGRIFGISFSKITNDYQIYLMNTNYFLNYEINNLFYFQNEKENLIILGKILITIIQREITKEKFLEIKVEVEGENEDKTFNFQKKDSPITIGRANCSINLNYSFISKKHSLIEFSEQYNKFYYKDLMSTNGSVLILKEDDTLKIKGDMKFKLNDINFHILELP